MQESCSDDVVEYTPAPVHKENELDWRDLSDRSLAAAVVRERQDAYAEVYRRHSASVAAATRMLLGARPACDDVVADVFVAFWLSPEKFDPDRGSLLAFLCLRARGRSIDVLRSERSRRHREDGDRLAALAPEPDVDSALQASEVAAALRAAVTSLPSTEREPISLAFFNAMSYRAVAAHLKLPEGTVKSRIRSGLRRLRLSGEVQALLDGDGCPLAEQTRSLLTSNLFLNDRGPE